MFGGRKSVTYLGGAWAPVGKFLGAVNFEEHFDIIRYLGYLGDKKSNSSNSTQIIWDAKFLNTSL